MKSAHLMNFHCYSVKNRTLGVRKAWLTSFHIKVMIIDGDMRHISTSAYIGSSSTGFRII